MRRPFRSAAVVLLAVGMVSALSAGLSPWLNADAVLFLYVLSILFVSLYVGRVATVVAAGLCALCWNYLHVRPLYTLHIERLEDAVLFAMFLLVALTAGAFTARLRSQIEATHVREERLAFLYESTSRLHGAIGVEAITALATRDLWDTFGAHARFYEPRPENAASGPDEAGSVFDWSLPTRPEAPLRVRLEGAAPLDAERRSLLRAYLNQVAILLDRERLQAVAQRARTNEEIDRLYRTLLDLITHELRTPMTFLQAALSTLGERASVSRPEGERQLLRDAAGALRRLDRLIENLLDMSRIESGRLTLNLDWCDLSEIVNGAVRAVLAEFPGRQVRVEIAARIPLVRVDFTLMEKALYNLVRNALLHNAEQEDLRVRVSVHQTRPDLLEVEVGDNGCGLPAESEAQPFARFARGNRSREGLGIGLSVVKGIVESHGATIRYRYDAGAVFAVVLPLTEGNSRAFSVDAAL